MDNREQNVESKLNHLNLEGFDERQITLIKDITNCYNSLREIEERNKGAEFSKFYLIFAYNLFDLGLDDLALSMLALVTPSYYGKPLLIDMRNAEEKWQQSEELKNKVDEQSKAHRDYCQQEAEFLFVAWGIIDRLKHNQSFSGSVYFLRFLKLLEGEVFKIKLRPNIGLCTSQTSPEVETLAPTSI